MLSVLTINTNNLTTVELIFLEKGHTQNENDSIHSCIERAKKGINIYHPYQWETLIQSACKSQPYNLKCLTQDDFFDFSMPLDGTYSFMMQNKLKYLQGKSTIVLWSSFMIQNKLKDLQGKSTIVLWSKVRHMI